MRTLKRVVFGLMVAGLAGVAWFIWAFNQPSQGVQPFNAAAWAAAPLHDTTNDPGCYRGGMAQDIIQKQLVLGKSASETASLLGAPDQRQPQHWVYPLGQCSGFGWHDSELRLVFNAGH